MALGDSVGIQAVEKIDLDTIPEIKQALLEVVSPFVKLLPSLQAVLDGKKRLVVSFEDVS